MIKGLSFVASLFVLLINLSHAADVVTMPGAPCTTKDGKTCASGTEGCICKE